MRIIWESLLDDDKICQKNIMGKRENRTKTSRDETDRKRDDFVNKNMMAILTNQAYFKELKMIRIAGSYCCYMLSSFVRLYIAVKLPFLFSCSISFPITVSMYIRTHTRFFFLSFSVSQSLVCSSHTMVRCQRNNIHISVWWLDRKIFTHYVYNDVKGEPDTK